MATVSIANLPAFVGAGGDVGDLLVMVDISDLSASPRGTTKKITFSQALSNIPGNVTVSGNLIVGGTVNFATPVPPTSGGTGLSAYTTGDLIYASATNVLARRAVGTTGQVLTVVGGVPAWQTPAPGGVVSVSGTPARIAITGTPSAPVVDIDAAYVGQGSITTLGTIATGTWNGTVINPQWGGTGIALYAVGDLLYASAVSTLVKLPIGTANQVLTVVGGVPTWQTPGALTTIPANNVTSGTFPGTYTFATGLTVQGGQLTAQNNGQALGVVNTAAGGSFNALAAFVRGANPVAYIMADPSDNLVIARGADGAVALSINRVNSLITVPSGGAIAFDAAIVGGEAIRFTMNNVLRWKIRKSGNTESTGDLGNDFVIEAFNDAGTAIDQPIFISRRLVGPIFISRSTVIGPDPGGTATLRVNPSASVRSTLTLGEEVPTTNSALAFNITGSNTQVNWRIGYQQTIVGGLEFARSIGAGGTTFAPPLLSLMPDNTVVIGTDPGTTRKLRVGGGAMFNQRVSIQGTIPADVALDGSNTDSTGYGMNITGGSASNYCLRVADYTNAALFQVFTGLVQASAQGALALLLHSPAANPAVALQYSASGAVKWQVGLNIGIGADTFEIYNSSASLNALRISPTNNVTTINSSFTGTGSWPLTVQCTGAAPTGIRSLFTAAAPNNATQQFLQCQDTAGVKARIDSNGGLANFSANNVNLSDARLKNAGTIVAAMDWWDRLAALEIRSYRYLDQTDDVDHIGVYAQQVKAVAAALVVDDAFPGDEGHPAFMGVRITDLFHAHIAVTQELMRRVLAIEARLPA